MHEEYMLKILQSFNFQDQVINSPLDLAATYFVINKIWEFTVRPGWQLILDKFEYSYYLFAG